MDGGGGASYVRECTCGGLLTPELLLGGGILLEFCARVCVCARAAGQHG